MRNLYKTRSVSFLNSPCSSASSVHGSPNDLSNGPLKVRVLRAACCLAVLGVLAVLAPVFASAQALAASELYAEGEAALTQKRFKAAAKALDAAYRLEPLPKTMFRLGLAYEGLGHPDKAAQALNAFLGFADATADAADMVAAREALARIAGAVAHFVVSLDPAGAVVTIDGRVVQPEKGELKVQTGSHHISIRAPDHEPYEQTIEVEPGRFELDIRLREITEPPEIRIARLLEQGDAQLQVGDVDGAVLKFDEAQRILPTPRGAGSAGLARAMLGDWQRAELGILEALESPRDRWVRKHRRQLKREKRNLSRKLGSLILQGDGSLAGASVTVNGAAAGSLPLPDGGILRVPAGVVVVAATLEGYEGYTFELELKAGTFRELRVTMMQAVPQVPPVVAEALPAEVPVATPPVAAAPGVPGGAVPAKPAAVPVKTPDVSTPLAEPTAEWDVEEGQARAEDIEYTVERWEGEESAENGDPATGLEMATNVGYQVNLKNGPSGASGALAMRLFSVGARPFWPISAGVQFLNVGVNWWNDGTQAVVALHPGLYVRGHSQRIRKVFAIDVWGGLAFQPVAMSVAAVEQESFDPSMIDFSALEGMTATDIGTDVVKGELGVRHAATIQSYNIPIELGVSFFVTEGLALELASALTFWVPTQACYLEESDRVCYDSKLKTQTSLYFGAGLTFLP